MIDERKKQGVKIGDRKESKTVNELNNIKELKNYNFKSKRNIKALKNKVTQERDDEVHVKQVCGPSRPPLLSFVDFYLVYY